MHCAAATMTHFTAARLFWYFHYSDLFIAHIVCLSSRLMALLTLGRKPYAVSDPLPVAPETLGSSALFLFPLPAKRGQSPRDRLTQKEAFGLLEVSVAASLTLVCTQILTSHDQGAFKLTFNPSKNGFPVPLVPLWPCRTVKTLLWVITDSWSGEGCVETGEWKRRIVGRQRVEIMQISRRQGQSWGGDLWGRKREEWPQEAPSVLQPLCGEANRRHWDVVAVNDFDLEAVPLCPARPPPKPPLHDLLSHEIL